MLIFPSDVFSYFSEIKKDRWLSEWLEAFYAGWTSVVTRSSFLSQSLTEETELPPSLFYNALVPSRLSTLQGCKGRGARGERGIFFVIFLPIVPFVIVSGSASLLRPWVNDRRLGMIHSVKLEARGLKVPSCLLLSLITGFTTALCMSKERRKLLKKGIAPP